MVADRDRAVAAEQPAQAVVGGGVHVHRHPAQLGERRHVHRGAGLEASREGRHMGLEQLEVGDGGAGVVGAVVRALIADPVLERGRDAVRIAQGIALHAAHQTVDIECCEPRALALGLHRAAVAVGAGVIRDRPENAGVAGDRGFARRQAATGLDQIGVPGERLGERGGQDGAHAALGVGERQQRRMAALLRYLLQLAQPLGIGRDAHGGAEPGAHVLLERVAGQALTDMMIEGRELRCELLQRHAGRDRLEVGLLDGLARRLRGLAGAVAGSEDPQHRSACGHERALAGCSCLAHLASLLLLSPASTGRRARHSLQRKSSPTLTQECSNARVAEYRDDRRFPVNSRRS